MRSLKKTNPTSSYYKNHRKSVPAKDKPVKYDITEQISVGQSCMYCFCNRQIKNEIKRRFAKFGFLDCNLFSIKNPKTGEKEIYKVVYSFSSFKVHCPDISVRRVK